MFTHRPHQQIILDSVEERRYLDPKPVRNASTAGAQLQRLRPRLPGSISVRVAVELRFDQRLKRTAWTTRSAAVGVPVTFFHLPLAARTRRIGARD